MFAKQTLLPSQTHNEHLHMKHSMEAGSMFPFKSPVPDAEEACIKYASYERTAAHPALPKQDFLGRPESWPPSSPSSQRENRPPSPTSHRPSGQVPPLAPPHVKALPFSFCLLNE